MSLEIIILAAGQGSRMRSSLPKVLHPIGNKSLLEHVHDLASGLNAQKITIIYGHGGEAVMSELSHLDVDWVEQKERLGTGHAVLQMVDRINDESTQLILYGDVPLLRQQTATRLLDMASDHALALLTVHLADPYGYGRIVRERNGQVIRIVEEKDATLEERAIQEGNTGIMAVKGGMLKRWLNRLGNHNAQGEYYLTDIIAMAVDDGIAVETTRPDSPDEVLGINTREQLAQLERAYQAEWAKRLMAEGVTLRDPARFDVRGRLDAIGQDVDIDINVILEGRVTIGNRVKIGPNTVIRDSVILDDVVILENCVIDNASVGRGSRIGPFARLRPETRLEADVHVGNFVEIKKATIASHSKVNHLSYIGDAVVGSKVNIGAGTITCNYDGVNKYQTIIEDGAFIGSDTQLIAPVTVGKDATIGAGSTLTRDAPSGALTLSRVKQITREGWRRPTKQKGD